MCQLLISTPLLLFLYSGNTMSTKAVTGDNVYVYPAWLWWGVQVHGENGDAIALAQKTTFDSGIIGPEGHSISRPSYLEVRHLPCPALPCPALPCPAPPRPALPCLALPRPTLPCPLPPCHAQPCPAVVSALFCRARTSLCFVRPV